MAKINSVIFSAFIFISFFVFLPLKALAVNLRISPATGSFETGERVTVKILAASENVSFNAVSGLVSFPTSILSIESVSKADSILNFWVSEPAISRSEGTVKFEGVALGGFNGPNIGVILSVNLRAVKAGSGRAAFRSGQVLANDGAGTDITRNLDGAIFYVTEATTKTTIQKEEVEPEPEILQPPPSLKAPEIVLGTKYGAQAILGTSEYPKTQVLITFTAADGAKVFILDVAEIDGSFNIFVPNSLKHGSYTVTALMIKEDKTNSETSNVITIAVGSIISDITWEIWLLITLLILAIIYLILRTHVHFDKNGGGSINKHKLHEAEEVVHKSFDILREDITLYDKEDLSTKEHKHIASVGKDINDAEKIIDKKIKDLES